MRNNGKIETILGLLLIAAALCLSVYNLWDEARAAKLADSALNGVLSQITADPIPREGRKGDGPGEIEYPDYLLNPDMPMPEVESGGQKYIGVVDLPSLGLELPVISQWSNAKLHTAPCRYKGSAYKNDLIVCAHNYSDHFGTLGNIRYGEEVVFTDMDGNRFEYEVIEVQQLEANAIQAMEEGEWDLTLFTCTVGGRYRVTVRCALSERFR